MSKKICIDTNVWLDYYLNRSQNNIMAELIQSLFTRTLGCEFTIVLSDFLLNEIHKFITIDILISDFQRKNKIIYVSVSKKDVVLSREYDIHVPDNIHLAIAKNSDCTYFVTNDKGLLNTKADIEIVSPQFFQFE